ncbi:MAG: ribosome silencing factor [Candidatus Omnitrophica bacterium]|nr:ribosome silencing factor [Candidatus Omnitrophota bacterium]
MARFVLEKKANKPVILDVREKCNFCDYFVICSAQTTIQVKAIYQEILKKSKEYNYQIHHSESDIAGKWILVDFFDVFLHIFTDELREFYNLQNLWRDAKKVRIRKQSN